MKKQIINKDLSNAEKKVRKAEQKFRLLKKQLKKQHTQSRDKRYNLAIQEIGDLGMKVSHTYQSFIRSEVYYNDILKMYYKKTSVSYLPQLDRFKIRRVETESSYYWYDERENYRASEYSNPIYHSMSRESPKVREQIGLGCLEALVRKARIEKKKISD